MSVSPWALILDDIRDRIAGAADGSPSGITPSYDADQRWRYLGRSRPEADSGRDRLFVMRRWSPMGSVEVFGGGEDQLGRELQLEVYYTDTDAFEDRRHSDEQDLIAALEPRDTYLSGTDWALRVRRVLRDGIDLSELGEGTATVKVTYPIRLVWREATSHV